MEIIITVKWIVGDEIHEHDIKAVLSDAEIESLDGIIQKWQPGSTQWVELQHPTPLTELDGHEVGLTTVLAILREFDNG